MHEVPEVQIGTATMHVGSDSYPVTVASVSKSGKTITLMERDLKFRWNAKLGKFVAGRKGVRGYTFRLSLGRGHMKLDPHF